MDNVLLMLLLSLPIYIIGAWTVANWLTDKVNFMYRIYQEYRWRKTYAISNNK